MAREAAVLRPVDERLGVLDAHAHGEGLLRHAHALTEQGLHRVPGAVTDAQQHRVAVQLPLPVPVAHRDARHAAAPEPQPRQPGLKAHLAAQLHNLLPHGGHHAPQQVGAHVGLLQIENLLRRAVAHEGLQHRAHMGRLDAGVQLAIGERARAALAELHVALRVHLALPLQPLHVQHALLHGPSPLDQDGPRPGPGQRQRRKEARRARAHHHGTLGKPGLGQRTRRPGRHPLDGAGLQAAQQRLLPVHLHLQIHHEVHIALVPGIHRQLPQRDLPDALRAHPEPPGRRLTQRRLAPVQPDGEIHDPKHLIPPPPHATAPAQALQRPLPGSPPASAPARGAGR